MAVDVIARLKLAGSTLGPAVDRELADVERKVENSGRRMGTGLSAGMATGLQAGVAAVGIAVAGTIAAVRGSMDFAVDLKSTAAELRVGVVELQAYRYAASELNVETRSMDKAIGSVNDKLAGAVTGNQAAVKAFSDLNVAITDVNGQSRSTDVVLRDVFDRLAAIEDPAQRAAAGTALFGDAYAALDPVVRRGSAGVDEATASMEAHNAALTAEEVQNLADMNAEWERAVNILSVNIASTVSANSDAIITMANNLGWLATKAIEAAGAWASFVQTQSNEGGFGQLTSVASAGSPAALLYRAMVRTEARRYGTGGAATGGARDGVGDSPFGTLADVRRLTAPGAGAVTRPTVRGGGGGRSGGGGVSAEERAQREAAREAARLAAERRRNEERLSDTLRVQLQSQSDAQRIEAIRLEQGNRAAEVAEAQADFLREHPEAVARTVEEFARLAELQPPVTEADRVRLQVLMDQLAVIQQQTIETINQRHEREQQAQAERKMKDEAEQMRQKAKEESDRQFQVMRERGERTMSDLADFYEGVFSGNTGNIWRDFKAQGLRALAELAAQMTLGRLTGGAPGAGGLLGGLIGGGAGAGGGGLFGGIGGVMGGLGGLFSKGGAASLVQGSAPAAATGALGAVGSAMPYAAAALAAFQVGKMLVGGLTTKRGSATLGFSDGQLGVGATRGNSAGRIAASRDGIDSVADTLAGIADALGGSISGAGSVSIGVRKKTYVVDPTGAGRTKGSGVLKFKTEEEAIQAAIRDALSDGVIGAISDASRRILASGQDLQVAIEKATLIESIPKALKARQDPVGAALDELNAKWEKTIAALKEGGATAEQMADAQKLYRLELEDTKASVTEASASLKGFLDSLNFGSSSPLSLRDQEAAARAALEPFLNRIDSGQGIDQQAYQEAAAAYLDIQRQLEASGPAFFATFDKIRDYTTRAIAKIDNATVLVPNDPFAEATASATQSTAEILAQQTGQLAAIENYLAQIAGGNAAFNAFIGDTRSFA